MMAGLKAVIYKDLKLFWKGTGRIALLLPFVMLFLMQATMSNFSAERFVQPFPIAIQDLDRTFMSRSMISQIKSVELFSEVILLEESDDPRQALDEGAVAVVTVPKDFFYDAYAFRKNPLHVLIGDENSLEGKLFGSIFTSIMDIMRTDQAMALSIYQFSYGFSMSTEQRKEMIRESASQLLNDVLARQNEFDQKVASADLKTALLHRISATLMTLSTLLIAFHSIKTVPEEIRLGITARYHAIGGKMRFFVLSKLIAGILFSLPTALLILFAYRRLHALTVENIFSILILYLILMISAFSMVLCLILLNKNIAVSQQIANFFILLSLLLGGTVLSSSAFPEFLQKIGHLTISHYALIALDSLGRISPGQMLALISPLYIQVLIFGLLSFAFIKYGNFSVPIFSEKKEGRKKNTARKKFLYGNLKANIFSSHLRLKKFSPEYSKEQNGFFEITDVQTSSIPHRIFSTAMLKLRGATGGKYGLLTLVILILLVGNILSAQQKTEIRDLKISVVDEDNSTSSEALIEALEQTEGLKLIINERNSALLALISGKTEGTLIIQKGFKRSVQGEEKSLLRYEAASSSLSAHGVREIIASKSIALKSFHHAFVRAEEKNGPLSENQKQRLEEKIRYNMASFRSLYQIEYADRSFSNEIFTPKPLGTLAWVVLMSLMTLGSFFRSSDHKKIAKRMRIYPQGNLLFFASDFVALSIIGLSLSLGILSFAHELSASSVLASISYTLCICSLILWTLQKTSIDGAIDASTPFVALILCLLGGCFADLSALSPAIQKMSFLSPAGQVIHAIEHPSMNLLLLMEATVFFLLGLKSDR